VSRAQYLPFGRPSFSEEEIAAVARVLRSGWVGMGPETLAFERELAEFLGARQVVTTSSCTAALFLSLVVSGVRAGDEVICPSFTWCSSANAALYAGAKPVFCDIDGETLSVTPQNVLAKLTPRTKAVVVVHLGGLAVDVEALREALPPGVAIVEDAAHAIGSRYPNGARVGSSGNPCCFSFYANKNLSTGEGGAVALADQEAAKRIQSLRQHALPLDAWQRFTHPQTMLLSNQLTELGYKMNYTDLQACIGRVQLRRQREFADIRHGIAAQYCERLGRVRPRIKFQHECTAARHALHLFIAMLPLEEMSASRAEVILGMRARNIGATIHYSPLHTMPLYTAGAAPDRLPVTEMVAKKCVTLPISASMTAEDAEDVLDSFEAVYR
jgi:dTDP-4-amino-4,6-dideoxygalactose transaminase